MKAIRQRDFKDCGVTCLEYIIEFYGGHVPIEKLREDTFTNQNGTTAYHLIETLKKYQFDAYGQKIAYEDLENSILPAILHVTLSNGLQHFVVITKWKKNEVTLMDPASGKRKMKKEELQSIWEGIVLSAIPKHFIPRIPKDKSILNHLTKCIQKEKKTICFLIFLSVLETLLMILTNLYFKISIDKIGVTERKYLIELMIIFGGMYLLKGVYELEKNILKQYLEKKIEIEYTFTFLKHLFHLPLEKFLTYHESEILMRVEEASEIKKAFEEIVITFFLESITAIFAILVLSYLNIQLSYLIIIGMVLYAGIGFLSSKSFYNLFLKNLETEKNWKEKIVDTVKIYGTMKHLNCTEYFMNELENNFCLTIKEKQKYEKKAFYYQFIKEHFLEILLFGITSYGILLIQDSKLSIIDFLVFQNLYFYFMNPIKELIDIGPKFYYLKGILTKLSETLSLKEEILEEKKVGIPSPSITVENLSYSYNGIQKNLERKSIKIEAKEHIFLDGPSGCGKSTLCKIFHKEIENYEGNIKFSEKNLKDYELSEIRASVIYLSQQENLLSTTIKENILFGKEENESFWQVVKICKIDEIVGNKAFRYETSINNDSLSGGEKQRILLARTLLKEGSLYLLDECLSEIEEERELEIIKSIRKYLKDKTIIYISHKDHSKEFDRRITL